MRTSSWLSLVLIGSVLAAPLSAQLPAGYTSEAAVLLPDTLYEVSGGGAFRIRIERGARDSVERRLIEQAERLFPPQAAIDSAVAKATTVHTAASFAAAAERPGPRWWWREGNGTLTPYALTGDAVAHAMERVRTLSRGPVPSYFQRGWHHKAYVTYSATVEERPTPDVAHRVHLKLDFFIECGSRCGYGYLPGRTVDFDAAGNVIAVSGDGHFIERFR